MPPPGVETAMARQQPWTVVYQATGTLEAANKADLNAESAGDVTAILVQEGQMVRRGQALMRLKADKQMAQMQQSAAGIAASLGQVEQQRADIRQAQARLDSAATRRQLAESELRRFEQLYKEQLISQWELDQRRTAYDTANSAYAEAVQALSSARARYAQASSSLAQARSEYRYSVAVAGESVIRAPFAGIVGQKYVNVGDYANPGQRLITVVETANFKIRFTVPERYLGQIRPGLPVTARFEGLGESEFPGFVIFIDPVIDPQAHTVTLKARIPGSGRLRHGMLGQVSLALNVIPDAVTLPEEAIVPQGDKTFVYVVQWETPPRKPISAVLTEASKQAQKTQVAHLREVRAGDRMLGRVRIDAGLQAGERVIVNGLQKVHDGQEVHATSAKDDMSEALVRPPKPGHMNRGKEP